MSKAEIIFVNTLNGKKQKVSVDINLKYGQIASMQSLVPPDVEWSILDEEGNDITETKVAEKECKAYITPGRDIAGGFF
ncbi:MAG: hypothetical protein GF329_14850 [Candidatus Lokiarchaeota archaeon]|nr:hypothetical protein [Candidatus Lokiarchaeota archaeon]